MSFRPLFGQIIILSLNLVNFRVSSFRVSHLTHETVKLCLQNTLNMSKMTKVYFGVLHEEREEFEILNLGSSVILFPLLSCYPEAHTAVTTQRIFVLRNEMRVGGERITEEETKNKKKKRGKEEERERYRE